MATPQISLTKLFAVLASLAFVFSAAHAETGISNTEIHIGSTGARSGTVTPETGGGMARGAQAYYEHVNASGGVNGRKIIFDPKDDVYDPAKAVANVKSLMEENKIFALVGGNGTPIAQALMPIIDSSGIPFLFTFSGGAIVYPVPPKKNMYQLRVSYGDEAASLVEYVVNDLKITDVGVFYQDDAFGISGRSGVERTLGKHGLKLNGIGTYDRVKVDVDQAVDALAKANPKAVYLQANAKPALDFITKCIAKGFKPLFLGQSAMGTVQMRNLIGKISAELYMSEVVPPANETKIPVIENFNRDMIAAGKSPIDGFALEGYLGAVVFVEAVKRSGAAPTRALLEKTIEGMNDFDLGGIKVSFNPQKHWGLNTNYIFHIKDGQVKFIR